MPDVNEHGHIIGRVVDVSLPLVVLDITGGVVQGEYLYEGKGLPALFVLDFDLGDAADEDDANEFRWATVEPACVAIEGRSEHPDDLAQVAEWRASADDLIEQWRGDAS